MWKTNEWLPTSCRPCVDRQTRLIQCLETAEDLALGNKSTSIVKDVACAGLSIPLKKRVCSETLCPGKNNKIRYYLFLFFVFSGAEISYSAQTCDAVRHVAYL